MRYIKYTFSPQILARFFREGSLNSFKVEQGIPKEAELRFCSVDPADGSIGIIMEDDNFNDVPEGQKIPIKIIMCRRLELKRIGQIEGVEFLEAGKSEDFGRVFK